MSDDIKFLTSPVYDIDRQEVAPAGVLVGKSLLETISGKGRPDGAPPTIADTRFPGDLDSIVTMPDLATLYEGDLADRITALVGRIALPEPVARELRVMRAEMPIIYHHSLATTCLTMRVSMEVTAKTEDLVKIGRATLLKDLGMTRIPDSLTRNRDYLTKQEYFYIRKHPILGLVLNTYYFGEGLEGMVALRHHMRNGAGYPQWSGLKPSRLIDIVETVDVFYALLSPRAFRPEPFDVRGALDQMTEMVDSGELSDLSLKLLVSCFREDKPELGRVSLSDERKGFVPEDNFYGLGPK